MKMRNTEEETCYVVKCNCVATRINKREQSQTLRLGTLVYVKYAVTAEMVAVRVDSSERLNNLSDEYLWECPILNIIPFDNSMKPYIIAIISPKERVELVQDEDLCQTLISFDVGRIVHVLPREVLSNTKRKGPQTVREAVIKYKGPVLQMGVGIYFGLELLDPDPSDLDTCDGSCLGGRSRYFSCPPDRGLFVAINRLRPAAATYQTYSPWEKSTYQSSPQKRLPFRTCAVQDVRAKFESMAHNNQVASRVERTEKLIDLSPNRSPTALEEVPLKVGDRVVWFQDSGQEHGTVRWLGHLEEQSGLQAGVEFDNPVGKSAGMYHNQQLFEAQKNHASFMQVMELVKADDLYEHSSSVDLLKKNKKLSPIDTPDCCATPSTSGSLASKCSVTLQPDQLYGTTKRRQQDSKWISNIVEVSDNHSVNVSLKSPSDVDCKPVSSADPVGKKDISSYGLTTGISTTNLKSRVTQDKINRKNCDPINFISNLDVLDISGHKLKAISKNGKVNNVCDSETIDSGCEWTGNKNQQWSSRSKQEYELNSTISPNGRLSKLNAKDRSPGYSHHEDDIDPGILQSVSPDEPGVLDDGYYDTLDNLHEPYDSPDLSGAHPDLGIGSVVEVQVKGEPLYGVIRWIGVLPNDKKTRRVAGIEMEEERSGFGDGTFHGHRYFMCNPKRSLFVNINQCQKDGRFQEPLPSASADSKNKSFGLDCPVIPGIVRPVAVSEDLQSKCGKFHGIQGHHNSCYLDATLFSMFTFTSVFDSLLYRPPTEKDSVQYEEVQRVLREEIVNPLRANLFVRADRVMKLRTLLENHSSVTGLTSEEKDPEEFLNSLVAQMLRAEPFLKLSSGQEAYHYQLFVEKDEQLKLPSVQKLFEQSFLASDIKLKEVPSCLIIQMPRFGKSFKMYPRILPSQVLDVTDVIEDSPRQCTVCGKLAEFECKECMDHFDVGLENISYCEQCLRTAHSHHRRSNHVWKHLSVPQDFKSLQEACSVIPRLYMELFAVVCIETSHYVAFVKCGSGSDAPWCFFDSMADRKGEQNGYNIPEMVPCPKLPYWLSDKGAQSLMDVRDNRQLPEHAKRLLCDAYMCMYQSADVMMYR